MECIIFPSFLFLFVVFRALLLNPNEALNMVTLSLIHIYHVWRLFKKMYSFIANASTIGTDIESSWDAPTIPVSYIH